MSRSKYDKAYEPYLREAKYCFKVDLIVALLIILFYCWLYASYSINPFSSFFFILIPPVYFLIEVVVNYRFGILSKIEQKKELFISNEIILKELRVEYSASGKYGSILPKLYPSSLKVDRYRIIGEDKNGKRIILRCAGSANRIQSLYNCIETSKADIQSVTYGKWSHILLSFGGRLWL